VASQFTISLHNVRFRAYHGLYPEERQKGNDFVVNMDVIYTPASQLITDIDETIDYARLYTIMNAVMEKPVDLLETVAQSICREIQQAYPQVQKVLVEVQKLNPPIDGFTGISAVRYETDFD